MTRDAMIDLNGPAGGALVGRSAPTEITGVSLRDECDSPEQPAHDCSHDCGDDEPEDDEW